MNRQGEPSDAGGIVDARVVAVCGLATIPGVGATALGKILKEFRTAEAAVEAGPRALLDRVTFREQQTRDYLEREPDLVALGEWAVEAAQKAKARVCLMEHDEYPALLRGIPSPPPVLYVRGSLGRPQLRVAVVGSREPDEVGRELARSFGDGLARAGVQVVSGGARGVDTYAHNGALWGHGSTVAVLGSGIDMPYPPENAELFDHVARTGGAVVSEFAPGTPPNPRNFPRRNRTVAGLCEATVVVRAAGRSGALITADQARAYGRRVFAVPGDPTNPLALGCILQLRKGAEPAGSFRDVLEALGLPVPEGVEDPPQRETPPVFPNPGGSAAVPVPDKQIVDEAGLKLWRLLDERTPVHVDDLSLRAQIPAQEALRKLAELELKGLCHQRPGKYFLRAKG